MMLNLWINNIISGIFIKVLQWMRENGKLHCTNKIGLAKLISNYVKNSQNYVCGHTYVYVNMCMRTRLHILMFRLKYMCM